MLKNYLSAGFVLLGCTFSLHQSIAGPLLSAEVTKIINRVAVIDPAQGEHPALIREVIKDELGLQTGEKSRSELLFQDNTLTRIGAETFFSFKTGTRDMTLEKGSMLLQVPKGLGGAKVHTAAVTAAITGTTIMMEYIPGKYIKVLVLEGSLRLSRNGTFGDSLVLRPGKMVIMRPDAKKIPEPIDVNLKQIVKTSTLVNFPDSAPLPSDGLIQAAIDAQNKSIAKGDLVPTNLVMGHGTDVILASDDQLAKIAALNPADVNGNGTAVVRLPSASNPDNGGTSLASAAPIADPVTDTVTSTVASVTDATTSLVESVANDSASLLGSLTGSATSLVGPVAGDTTAVLGSLTAPVAPVLGTVTDTTTSLVASVTTSAASLPIVGSVTDSAASLLSSVTTSTAALPSLGSVTDTISSLTASAPPVASIIGTTTSILGSAVTSAPPLPILASVTGSAASLPIVGTATQSTPVSAINSLATSTSSASTTVSTLLGATQTATSPTVSVASSTQLLSMLSNTAPSTGGRTITISPTSVNGATVAGTPTATSAPPLASSTTSPTVASSSPTTTSAGPTGTTSVITLTSVPTTLASAKVPSRETTKTVLPLLKR